MENKMNEKDVQITTTEEKKVNDHSGLKMVLKSGALIGLGWLGKTIWDNTLGAKH